jgi:molybdopterin-guanine dinucleotide biosynthesis protein A
MLNNITGIILAGGQSKRMGSEKGLVLLHGKPLISYAIGILSGFCDTVLISSNSDAYDDLGLKVVPDLLANKGPMGGVYSCLKEVKTSFAFVLSVDMPLVDRQIIDRLLAEKDEYQVVLPCLQGFVQPVCACYKHEILPLLETELIAERLKLKGFIETLHYKAIDISVEDGYTLFSINTKEDVLKASGMSFTGAAFAG